MGGGGKKNFKLQFFANSDFNSLGSKHSRWTTTFPALFFICCSCVADCLPRKTLGWTINVHVTNSEKNGSPTIRRNINTLATIRRIGFSRTSSTFGLISLLLTKFLLNSFDLFCFSRETGPILILFFYILPN